MAHQDPWVIAGGPLVNLRLPPVYYWAHGDPMELITEWQQVAERFDRTAASLGGHPAAEQFADAVKRINQRLPDWIAAGRPDMDDHEALAGEMRLIGHRVDSLFGLTR